VPGGTQDTVIHLLAFVYWTLTIFGRLSHTFPLAFRFHVTVLQPHPYDGLGFSHFARHYFGNNLFSSGYLDVSVPQVPLSTL